MEVVSAEVNSLLPEEIMDTEAIVLVEDDHVGAVDDSELEEEVPMETELAGIVNLDTAVPQSVQVSESKTTSSIGSQLLLTSSTTATTTSMTGLKAAAPMPVSTQPSSSVSGGLQKLNTPVTITANQVILNKVSQSPSSDLKPTTTQVFKQDGQKLFVTTIGKSGQPIVLTLPHTSHLAQSPKAGQGQGMGLDTKIQPQQFKVVTIGSRTDLKPVIGVQAMGSGNQLISTSQHSTLQAQQLKTIQVKK